VRRAGIGVVLVALAGCRAEPHPGPAAPSSPTLTPAPPPPPPPEAEPPAQQATIAPPPASPEFVTTESSDAWVERTFHVQARPARVLAVVARGAAPRTVRAATLDLNARVASPASARDDLPVTETFATLQEAADAARGGDLVAVMPGTYTGFHLGDKRDAGDGKYIHFKAMGKPGEVVISRPSARDRRWMILLEAAHHVILQGFNLAGVETPGDMGASGPWAGIMLDGDFGRSGKEVHHVAVIGNFSHDHARWGLHATDTHTVLLEDNLFARSAMEHAAYVSDGSDDYVIRRNVFFGAYASGLQVNLDPEASLQEILKHPSLRDYPREKKPTRAWAEGLLALARARFGEHNFPDGRGVNFIIEENVMNANGRRGGGSLNLAGLSRSLIQNNLVYGNHNHGIAQWDNANPFDAAGLAEPPQTPEESTPARLPLWGCQDNVLRNNTVLMSDPARAALQCHHGSFGCRIYDNVLVNDAGPSIQVDATSLGGLDARANVLNGWTDDGLPAALRPLAARLPDGGENTLNVTQARLAGELVRPGVEPWVILERGWWRLNPKRPDFHPRAGSALLAGKGDATRMAPRDLEGNRRAAPDLGALGAAR
jgi:hypothetical protein